MPRDTHILIVETDDLIRQLLLRWLGEAGYVVEICAPDDASAQTAASASASAPDLVIVDVPDPRGAQPLLQSLRTGQGVPVLVVSARLRRGLARSAEAARRLGVRKVLSKPFSREQLLAAVSEALDASAG